MTQSAAEDAESDEIIVTGRRVNLLGTATTASEGRVGREDLDARPLLRSGDLLEFVPGLVATQHSGSGKANQYFLRGFNLDHGTDFATSVDGMPVNMRTHGHGQGPRRVSTREKARPKGGRASLTWFGRVRTAAETPRPTHRLVRG